jgi:plasmid stabilization system protein ParE
VAVKLHPGAQQDIKAAHEYYVEAESVSLAMEFRAELENAFERIERFPRTWPNRLGARRYIMRRFPFSVFYEIEGQDIAVIAVAHHKRRPGYWKGRD